MTIPVSRSHTVTARIEMPVRTPARPVQVAGSPVPAPVMSMEEYQRRTLDELADDVIVGGVAYSRTEWDRIQDGAQHTTTVETPAPAPVPAARRTRPTWNGIDAPF